MFDFHLHSSLSYDSQASAQDMVAAAQRAGLREICFTEHRDYLHCQPRESTTYRLEDYHRVLDALEAARSGWQEANEKLRRMRHLGNGSRFERGQWHESGFSGF